MTVLMHFLPFITVFLLYSNGSDEKYYYVQLEDNDISSFKILCSHPQAGGGGKLLPLALEYRAVDNVDGGITTNLRNSWGRTAFGRRVARLPRNQFAVPVGGGSGGDSVMRGKIGCNSLQTGRFAIGGSSDGKLRISFLQTDQAQVGLPLAAPATATGSQECWRSVWRSCSSRCGGS